MVLGAATLFRGMAVWRHVTRDWAGLQSLCLALTASAAHTGIDAQTALSVCSFIFVLRFMRPPVPLGQTVVPEAAELCADAIAAATSDGRGQQPGGAPAALMPWRYAAAANSYPLMVLPCLDESAAAALMRHYASQLDSDILVTRQLAAAGISTLLLPLMLPALASKPYVAERCVSLATANAARAALAEILTARAHDLIPNLISHLANSHPALVSGGDPQGQRGGMMSLSRDDMVSKTLTATLIKGAQWPAGSQHIPAVFAGQFLPSHARAAQALCFAAPEAVLTAVRAPIEAVLGKSQDSDRPAVAAAAEALAGIVGSGAPFETGAWDEWVGAALATALANAPLDFVDLWGGAVLQYAVFELHKSGKDEAIGALVQTILRATGAANGSSATRTGAAGGGSTSGALYKRLAYLNSVLTELVCLGASGNPPKSMRTLLAVVLDELPSLTQAPGEMVRQAAAGLVADATLALLEARATPESPSDGSLVSHEELSSGNGMYGNNGNGSGPDAMDIEGDAVLLLRTNLSRLHAAARALLDKVAADLEAGTAVLYDRARSSGGHHHPAAPVLQAMSSENDADVMHAADAVVQAVVADEVRASQEAAVEAHDDADADVEVVLAPGDEEDMEGDAPGGSGEMVSGQSVEMFRAAAAAAGGADAEYETALAHVAFGVEVVVQLLASTTSAVEPWLVRMLPSLLRLQELVPSELQFVALVASKALRGAKYQPLNTKHAAEALAALRHALHAELWTERAAALAFLQYFWFRHGPVLGRQGTAQVVEEVLQRLEDSKLEVRELAAATLSGVLRGLAPEEQAALRKRCLARAADLFPGRRRRRLDGDVTAAQQAPLPERHGVVLALKAFVLSSPYDVPPWLPQVLMALVQLASEPAPVRTTVTKALSDFRRTHEETGLAEVKDQLTQEQWEAIRDVASPASYFV